MTKTVTKTVKQPTKKIAPKYTSKGTRARLNNAAEKSFFKSKISK